MKSITALNNKLNGCSLEQDGEDFYIVGADAVRKKLGSGKLKVVSLGMVSNPGQGTTTKSFTVTDAVEGTVHGIILSAETHATYRAAWNSDYDRFNISTNGNTVTGTISANHSTNSTYYSASMTVGAAYIAK